MGGHVRAREAGGTVAVGGRGGEHLASRAPTTYWPMRTESWIHRLPAQHRSAEAGEMVLQKQASELKELGERSRR